MNLKPTAKRLGSLFLLLTVLISGFLSFGVRIGAQPPVIRKYVIESPKILSPMTLVMLTDLHGSEHGEGNSTLIEKIKEISPDIVLICGDMINDHHATGEDILITTALIMELSLLAPVYYSLGNHELARTVVYLPTSFKEFKDAGATILEQKYEDIDIRGNSIRVGGLYTPNNEETKKPDGSLRTEFYTKLCDTDRFVILLEHRPSSFTDQIYPRGFEPELVLSGHLHGGHVILPFLGPVYGSNSGFFPKYALGKHELGNSTLIISAGLSTERHIIPRIGNPTEITQINLEPIK